MTADLWVGIVVLFIVAIMYVIQARSRTRAKAQLVADLKQISNDILLERSDNDTVL